MSSKWNKVLLSELVTVKGGKRLPKGSSLQNQRNEHPYIRVRDMGEKYIPSQGLEFVPDEVFPAIQRYIVNENDVILSIVGTVGLVSIVDANISLASLTENAAKLTGLDSKDAHYLYYYLKSDFGAIEINKRVVGAVQPKLPLYNIENIPVIWPSRESRINIADLFCLLDDKIIMAQRINHTLEQMAQALFKSWFVDFEPVKAKITALEAGGSQDDATLAAMTVISGKEADALTVFEREHPEQYAEFKATAELFPSAMEDSELGEIPEGWCVESYRTFCDFVQSGGTPKRSEQTYWDDGDIRWLSSGEVRDKIVFDTKEKITEVGLKNSTAKLWPKYSTIMAMYGATAGEICLLANEMSANQACCALYSKKYSFFIYFSLCNGASFIASKASGSAQQNLNKGIIENAVFCKPTESLIEIYNKTINGLMLMWISNVKYNNNLTQLRDTLLPKLLSGEITLPEAEQALSEAENV